MDKKYYLTVNCSSCGKEVNITKYRFKERNGVVLCRKCSINNTYKNNPEKLKIANEKRIQTVLKTYGCENVAQNKEIQEKWINTKLKRTGYKGAFADLKWINKIEEQSHSEEANKKRKNTCLNRYGVEHHMKNKNISSHLFDNYKEKTGYDCPMHNPEIIKKNHKKGYVYNNLFFDSSWELAYYIYLIDFNINFEYHPKNYIEYLDNNNKKHVYQPDFIVNNEFQEIKGDQFFNDKNEPWDPYHKNFWWEKYNCLVNNNIKILKHSDIKQYINYVKKQYGNKFFKLHRI